MRTAPLLIVALASAALTGCSRSSTHEASYELFGSETEVHDMDHFAAAQSAAGARQDGMLYGHHFAGPELNSLGRSKLHLMATDKPVSEPLVVYLNTTNDTASAQRQSAITKYLQEHGLASADIQVKTGANPNTASGTSAALLHYSKTESSSPEGAASSAPANMGSFSNSSSPAK